MLEASQAAPERRSMAESLIALDMSMPDSQSVSSLLDKKDCYQLQSQ
jgi:hypothetical protein